MLVKRQTIAAIIAEPLRDVCAFLHFKKINTSAVTERITAGGITNKCQVSRYAGIIEIADFTILKSDALKGVVL